MPHGRHLRRWRLGRLQRGFGIGEHIVFYFDEIGRIEGPVTRLFNGGFASSIQATQHRREKLAAQLTWLMNRALLGAPETRRHDRSEPGNTQSQLTMPNGSNVPCRALTYRSLVLDRDQPAD